MKVYYDYGNTRLENGMDWTFRLSGHGESDGNGDGSGDSSGVGRPDGSSGWLCALGTGGGIENGSGYGHGNHQTSGDKHGGGPEE